jgi:Ca-activated chloride channel family protein
MSPYMRFRLQVFAVFCLGCLPGAAVYAQDRIQLAVEPSQSVLSAGEANKAYLRVKLEGLAASEAVSRPPVNVSLVIDRSGSMQGAKIEQAKEAAILALSRLSRKDRVSVIAFDHQVDVIVPAGPFEDFSEMKRRIDGIYARGQTAIYAAVRQAGQSVGEAVSPERISRVILMSDGLDYSEELMTRLALASDGNHAFVENPEQLAGIFNKEFGDVLSVVGQDVDIEIDCPDGVTPLRGLGRDVKINGRHVSFRLNQVGEKQERYIVVELEVAKGKAQGPAAIADVGVSYLDPKTKSRSKMTAKAEVSFSTSADEVSRSANASVSATVATQLANERSEKAVLTRDTGNIAEARRQLEQNASDLRAQADRVQAQAPAAAASLRKLSEKNAADAKALSTENWGRLRKSMTEEQYRAKTQQNYSR